MDKAMELLKLFFEKHLIPTIVSVSGAIALLFLKMLG